MQGITGDFDALVAKDFYSKVKVLLPVRNKIGEEATRALMYVLNWQPRCLSVLLR